jgi:hypothetical protein
MHRLIKTLSFSLLVLFFHSCITPPENFPTTPEIEFKELIFSPSNGNADSLLLSIKFKDAEGDLGLNSTDIQPPYNPLEYLRDAAGNLIFYKNRPPSAPSFNPVDWEINPTVNNVIIRDTVWVKQNPNQFNIFVKFYVKRNGVFREFRWQDPPFYTTFNGRFPRILNTDNKTKAIEGVIQYRMLSFGWSSIFRNDTLKIEAQIQDRALNKSNTVSSPELTLSQIRRN